MQIRNKQNKQNKQSNCFIVASKDTSFIVYRVLADDISTHRPLKTEQVETHIYAERWLALNICEQLEKELHRLNKYGFTDLEIVLRRHIK